MYSGHEPGPYTQEQILGDIEYQNLDSLLLYNDWTPHLRKPIATGHAVAPVLKYLVLGKSNKLVHPDIDCLVAMTLYLQTSRLVLASGFYT
jgi:hypothetical protein